MKATRTCSVPDCERPSKSRGWCNTHYERWRITGTTDDPVKCDPICGVSGCERPTKARGWCKYHWQRWSRTGDPVEGAAIRRGSTTDMCAVGDCEETDVALGYCKAHHYRWKTYGDPLAGPEPWHRPDDWTPTYGAAHWRVYVARGLARDHRCVDCGGPAEHWSYDHTDPDELVAPDGLAYSLDVDRYEPRCVSCHRKFDHAA